MILKYYQKLKVEKSTLLRNLWSNFSYRRKIQLSLLLPLMILASFAEVISIGSIIPLIGALMNPEKLFYNENLQFLINILAIKNPNEILLPLTIIFSLAAITSGILRLTLLWVQTKLSHSIGVDLSIDVFKKTMFQNYELHISRNSSEIIAIISSKVKIVVYSILWPFLMFISSSMILITIVLTLLIIEPNVALICITTFGVFYLFTILFFKKRLDIYSEIISVNENKVIKILQEGLNGIRDVLLSSNQYTYINAFKNADAPLKNAQANAQIAGNSPRLIIEAFAMVIIAVISYFFAKNDNNFTDVIPVVAALALGGQRLLPLTQQLYASWASIQSGLNSLLDVLNLLNQSMVDLNDQEKIYKPLKFTQSFSLKSISFKYKKTQNYIFKDLNLKIPKGARVGIIGKTGVGKSTLVDIITGLLEPENGKILLDNIELSFKDKKSWQSMIAHVPQDIFIIDSTIINNIALGIPEKNIDINRVKKVAKQAKISNFIENLENQYQTLLGERGVRLSGGQKQRLGIARALYRKASIIIFDEATSALDNKTEKSLINSINKLNKKLTLIMVAHRISTLEKCDFIVELDKNKVIKLDTYENILKKLT